MLQNPLSKLYSYEAKLIQDIYQCINKPELWVEFIQNLTDILGGRSARMLMMNGSATEIHQRIAINHDEYFMGQYENYYVNKCPWRPELANKPKGALYSTYFDFSCKQDSFLQSEFYNDWAKPQGIEHGICGTILEQPQQTIQLLVQRTKQSGHFTLDETAFVNRLVPHIQNAIILNEKMAGMQAMQQGISQLSSSYTQPFALIDETMKVCFISEKMEQAIARSASLTLAANKLIVRNNKDNMQLERLLRETHLASRGLGNSAGGLVRISDDRDTNLQLKVMPFFTEDNNMFMFSKHIFSVVFLSSLNIKLILDKQQLKTQYQLTERECQLANQLCKGFSVDQIAGHDGVKPNTLRKQLKSIYAKTNTHQQSELVAVLLNSFAAQH